MRLLLDEHFSQTVARALRDRNLDVVAVAERKDLRGLSDIEVLGVAASEGRVVVTADIGDFVKLAARRLPDRTWHRGVVLVPRRALPRSADDFGRLIRALEALLAAHPGDDDLISDVHWLQPVPEDQATD